jgi:PAS domain S-box-containing protein
MWSLAITGNPERLLLSMRMLLERIGEKSKAAKWINHQYLVSSKQKTGGFAGDSKRPKKCCDRTGGADRVRTLGGADEAYRTFVEVMCQGAATVAADGSILYCNPHFGKMLQAPLDRVIGSSVFDLVTAEDEGALRALLWEGMSASCAGRPFMLRRHDGRWCARATFRQRLIRHGVRPGPALKQEGSLETRYFPNRSFCLTARARL